ncbi:MAG: TRAP transporter large permease [Alphaproteobacteria bacterium]|nr:TRAP transporter large permease [Alphaproteobacteria bacterium]
MPGPKVLFFLVMVVGLLFLRQPVVLVLAVVAAYTHAFFATNSGVEFLLQDMWFVVNREVLLSIPMFIVAGAIMTRGSIAQRLINVMIELTAPIPGGLGVAAVLGCAVFAAISGSSIVTMLAIGSIMYPAMIGAGYNKLFSLGLIASAGTLGIMIPPSIPLILFGIMTEVSITEMFKAGIGPGLLLTLAFAVYSYAMNRHMPTKRWSLSGIAKALREGIWAMLLPVILLGGIYSGYFSPTEAAAVSVLYAVIVETLIHRDMKLPDYGKVLVETVQLLGVLLPLLAIAASLNTVLDYEGVADGWVNFVKAHVTDKVTMMIGINLLLLVVGCLMDAGSAIIVFSPLLLPLATSVGYDPVHFGIIMTANLEIGYLTPPVGLNLIVAMAAFKENFWTICKAAIPFVVLMLLWLVVVIAFPGLSLYFAK